MINMYTGTFVVIHKLFRSFLYEHCCDDEGFIETAPKYTRTHHIIRSDFVIVHYLFNTKYLDGTLLQKMAEDGRATGKRRSRMDELHRI